MTLGLAPEAEAQVPPAIGGPASCTASSGTDVVFLIDDSSSIDLLSYWTYASTVTSVAAALSAASPSTRIAVAHYAGHGGGADFGQNLYLERDFSTAALTSPQRRFSLGGSYNAFLHMDNLAGAVLQLSYALDGDAATVSSYVLSPLRELNRDLTRSLQIVVFTDAAREISGNSAIIDGAGYGSTGKDGSNFTIYNRLKGQGVKFSVAAFAMATAEAQAAAAAVASVGGSWQGAVEANAQDPEASQTKPRRLETSANFTMTSARILDFVTAVANPCPPPVIDYGDAPASYGAPGHIVKAGGPRLGPTAPDGEAAPHHSANSSGDDLNGTDDEDGISFGDPQVGQSVLMIAYLPSRYASGYLNAWIDWNRDGDFLDAGEQIAVDRRDDGTQHDYGYNDGQLQVLVGVPATAVAGQSYNARFRLSTQAGLAPHSGIAPDGEIEDHAFTVNAYTPPVGAPIGACAGPNLLSNGDFANASNWAISYASPSSSGGYAIGEPGYSSSLTTAPVYRNNASGVFRSYVDTVGDLGGVAGLHLRNESRVSVVQGGGYVFSYDFQRIVNSADVDATLNWALINPTTNAVVQIIPGVSRTLSGAPTVWTQYASNFVATAPTGEYKVALTFVPQIVSSNVIDYYLDRVYFAPVYTCDFGDAPASYGEPMHLIAGNLKLGAASPDGESAHQPSAAASGDDEAGADDEDGVSAFPPLFSGQTSYSLPPARFSASGTGTLRAWIDFDKNGVFTANEQASVEVANGVPTGPLNWTGILIGAPGVSYARLRFASTALTDLASTPNLDERAIDPAYDGEVEDYAVTFQTAALPPNAGLAVCATPEGASGPGSWPVGWTHNSPGLTYNADARWPNLPAGSEILGPPGVEISAAQALIPGSGISYVPVGGAAYAAYDAGFAGAVQAYSAQDHLSYSFVASTALRPGAYLRRFSLSLPASASAHAPFRTTILISTDPSFATAVIALDGYLVTALGRLVMAAEAPVLLTPGVAYHLRAVLHGVASSSGGAFWDDFFLDVSGCADLSDAPLSYGEAQHFGDAALRLGAARDAEHLSIASLDASGEGSDDDGAFFGTAAGGIGLQNQSFTQGLPQMLEFAVTGSGGRLSGWFDWNRDGVFSGPEEQPFAEIFDNGPGDLNPTLGVIGLSVTPPALASGQSFARFRWSSTPSLGADGAAPDGEVEDYAIALIAEGQLAFVLSPNHDSLAEPGQLTIYAHRLLIGEGLSGGAVDFQIDSDGGLAWSLLRDDGDGVYGAGDAPWPSGGALLPAGSHSFWLVVQIPQETPAEWRDLTLLRARILSGGVSRSAEAQDLTRVAGGSSGRLFAHKLQARDADCDGIPDAGEAGFSTEPQAIAPGGCAIYRILFENAGADQIRRLRVQDHTPAWMTYRAASAQNLVVPAGLTALTPVLPADGQEGEVSFPFDGVLSPGERGVVEFSVRLLGAAGGGGAHQPN